MKISEHLEPVIYTEGSYIIRQGEPLDMLFFITQGIVLTYAKNKARSGTTQHEKQEDGFYGKELITWGENSSNKLSNLPISPITVKAHKKVEVFALKATDLQHVLANLPKSFCTILWDKILQINLCLSLAGYLFFSILEVLYNKTSKDIIEFYFIFVQWKPYSVALIILRLDDN